MSRFCKTVAILATGGLAFALDPVWVFNDSPGTWKLCSGFLTGPITLTGADGVRTHHVQGTGLDRAINPGERVRIELTNGARSILQTFQLWDEKGASLTGDLEPAFSYLSTVFSDEDGGARTCYLSRGEVVPYTTYTDEDSRTLTIAVDRVPQAPAG